MKFVAHEVFDCLTMINGILERCETSLASLSLRPIARELQTHAKDIGELEFGILKECGAKLDEMGQLVPDKDGAGNPKPGTYVIEDAEKAAECLKRRQELMQTEVEIDVKPVSAKRLSAAGLELKGFEVMVLGDLIHNDFEEES